MKCWGKIAVAVAALAVACATPRVESEATEAPSDAPRHLARIAALEDARTDGGGELAAFLSHREARVRIRAATALGRLWYPEVGAEVTRALLGALFDADAGVRGAAAFGLGVRGDPSAADKLVFVALDHHERDRDPVVRARAVEAASKLDRPELRERLLDGLLDPDPRVRVEAAAAPMRWPADEAVDRRLVEHVALESDRNVITYALAALERRKSEAARDVFLRFAKSEDVEQRIFAVRGLARISPSDASRAALVAATQDADWRVACEALIGLGNQPSEAAFEALRTPMRHANAHVRSTAELQIAEMHTNAPDAVPERVDLWPEGDQADPSLEVRVSRTAVFTLLACEIPRSFGADLETFDFTNVLSQSTDDLVRDAEDLPSVRVAQGRAMSRFAPPTVARQFLMGLATDEHVIVCGAAIEALGKHLDDVTRTFVHGFLSHSDNGLRLAAVNALAEMPDASDVEPLARCYETSSGDGANEIRFSVLRALGKIGGDDAKWLISVRTADPSPFVRRVAREELAKLGVESELSELAPPHEASPRPLDIEPVRLNAPEPRVEVVTSRGTMVFELFPREAPVHVHNFLTLAERGHYDGLTFHRVVPDFVIQGGDYRGDGNGGGTWRARDDSLRHEFTPRKYVRGSLGMPRNDDPDSGGSQFFVTHRATPHLDGRYTLFGELTDGAEVLDAIEVGDTIVRVRRLR